MHARLLGLALAAGLAGTWSAARADEEPPKATSYRVFEAKVLRRAHLARATALRGARNARDIAIRNARRCAATADPDDSDVDAHQWETKP